MSNWFSKLGLGLKKSSTPLTSGLGSIFSKKKLDSSTLEELEELLICSDMGGKASSQIIKNFSAQRVNKEATNEDIRQTLADSLATVLKNCEKEFELGETDPVVIMMVGVNGAGKTTAIGKLAAKFKDKKISFIAGDTFRAAAVEQLSVWGERNKTRKSQNIAPRRRSNR